MKALLTPHIQPDLGLIILKPGTELLKKLGTDRLVISSCSPHHNNLPSGIINDRQQLAGNKLLNPFLLNEKVFNTAGGKKGLYYWLEHTIKSCQLDDGVYCYHECTNKDIENGAVRVCWHHHDTELINIEGLAARNIKEYIISSIITDLKLGNDHQLTLPELCWWAVINNVYDVIPEDIARLSLNMPVEVIKNVYKESDIKAYDDRAKPKLKASIDLAQEHINVLDKPIKKLAIDPESPESFMLRPKIKRWECEKYTQWVKTQPCLCCGKQADDPHHIIGHGQGKMGGKTHDLFTLPLCRICHNELHHNVEDWESRNGSQILLLINFLDRVLGMKVII